MPFGLKNAGATYQREKTTIFHDFMQILMEDYVDDLLFKSYKRKEHLGILDQIFTKMESYKLCLNPKKCVFGVVSRKLLGYIIFKSIISINLKRIKVILNFLTLHSSKELKYFFRKINFV